MQTIILDSSSAQVSSDCCPIKMLNDEVYRLQGEENTEQFACEDDCVYKKDGDVENKYCFALGNDDVQCKSKYIEDKGNGVD